MSYSPQSLPQQHYEIGLTQLPDLSPEGKKHPLLGTILQMQQSERPLKTIHRIMQELHALPEEKRVLRAALLSLNAETLRLAEQLGEAQKLAQASLKLWPEQWYANHVLLLIEEARQDIHAAEKRLLTIMPHRNQWTLPFWDTFPEEQTLRLHQVKLAWLSQQWDRALSLLHQTFPGGPTTAPEKIRQSWFYLSLYGNAPQDAFLLCESFLPTLTLDAADALLQLFVLKGWIKEGVTLYEQLFRQFPASVLLRRRLIALYLRLKRTKEARILAEGGSIFMAA